MPHIDKNDKFAKWLIRKSMKRWEIILYYHLSADYNFIEYLKIQARCPFISVNPTYIEQTVKQTLKSFWYINDENKRIPLKLDMNEGKSYVVRRMYPGDGDSLSLFEYVYELIKEVDSTNANYS
jgi:hypothetical protein